MCVCGECVGDEWELRALVCVWMCVWKQQRSRGSAMIDDSGLTHEANDDYSQMTRLASTGRERERERKRERERGTHKPQDNLDFAATPAVSRPRDRHPVTALSFGSAARRI